MDTVQVGVVDDLEELIRVDLLGRLPLGSSMGELAGMSLSRLVIVYLNWRGRYVPPVPRRVHMAPELVRSSAYAAYRHVVDEIAARIAMGYDVTPHLSHNVAVAHTSPSDAGRRKDLDRLIADWGIHHLHLSLDVQKDEFVSRTGDLLFVALQPTEAYLIGVFPHRGAWTRSDLAETCVRNWPQSGLFHEMAGAVGLTQEFDEADRAKLRAAGITTLMEIDGRVWMPPGQTIAGTPTTATRRANALMHDLRELREQLARDSPKLTALIRVEGGDLTGKIPRWEAGSERGWYGLRESNTGVFAPMIRIDG